MILTIIALGLTFNALLFAWLAFGRYVNCSSVTARSAGSDS